VNPRSAFDPPPGVKRGASCHAECEQVAQQAKDLARVEAIRAAQQADWGQAGAPHSTALINQAKRRGSAPYRHVL
jgi:hypothetical protein